jgi:hypothetical protein
LALVVDIALIWLGWQAIAALVAYIF